MALADGYELRDGPPPVAVYLELRRTSGLKPKSEEQALAGLPGSWAAVHVVLLPSGAPVAMGRVIGDGGWYFSIVDMAVLPSHQRRGIGDHVLGVLLDRIRSKAPEGAYVNLLADEPGRGLYERHGFAPTAPESIGMALRLQNAARG